MAITVCVPTAHIDIAVVIGGTSGAQCRGNDLDQSIAPFIFRRMRTTREANIYLTRAGPAVALPGRIQTHTRAHTSAI